ncbi:MAG TPA: patatin-like phospholipase family protein [Candidatus Binatia bacterium]
MERDANETQPFLLPEVLEEEFRQLHGSLPPISESGNDRLAQIYRSIHAQNHAALSLSGGGIRSASFGLGIIQGLARYHLLERFDYLSTVSGGGYIGSWMTAWIHRHETGRGGVIDELSRFRDSKIDPEHEPIRRLREYSHYLTPRWGLLSADTWTWIAIYLRNLFLNWLVLITLLAAALAIPRLCVEVVRLNPDLNATTDLLATWGWNLGPFSTLLTIGGFVFTVLAIDYVNVNLPITGKNEGQGSFLRGCLLPLACAAIALTTAWAWFRNSQPARSELPGPGALMLLGVLLHLAGCSVYLLRLKARESLRDLKGVLSAAGLFYLFIIIAAGAVGGFLVWCAATTDFFSQPKNLPEFYVSFAAPLLLTLFMLATAVYIGLASYITSDADREWWARAGGWVLITVVCWIVLSWLVLSGPGFVAELEGTTKQFVLGVGGLSGLVTILIGRSGVTPANRKEGEQAGWISLLWSQATTLAAPIFAGFIVIAISFGTGWLLNVLNNALFDFQLVAGNPFLLLLALILFLLGVGLLMGFFINANKFSLHGAYRDRLIRAYLGASHEERHPNLFTGFDPADNLPMYELQLGAQTKKFERPFHVVNITLNLVKGGNLAWQERKAESFTVTPLHSGSYRLGYRPSEQYGGKKGLDGGNGISLGTAIAISGAAASPNWGYHSSPLVTFLLALFNVRLGWWLGNPGSAGARTFRNRGPSFAVWPLIEETFGLTTDTNEYVYLSDGGHFENLGLYEMVLRRCRVIILSDAGCDPKCELEDLGNAIRKIRVDLGVSIEFKEDFLIYARNTKPGKRWALGTIGYSAVDAGMPDGLLIYLKPAFYGDEPIDIFNYATANPQFPHESTLDQWFSESQFESYRMLGAYTVEHIVQELDKRDWQGTALEGFVAARPTG